MTSARPSTAGGAHPGLVVPAQLGLDVFGLVRGRRREPPVDAGQQADPLGQGKVGAGARDQHLVPVDRRGLPGASRLRASVRISSKRSPGVRVRRRQVTASAACRARASGRTAAVGGDHGGAGHRHQLAALHQIVVLAVSPVDPVVVQAGPELQPLVQAAPSSVSCATEAMPWDTNSRWLGPITTYEPGWVSGDQLQRLQREGIAADGGVAQHLSDVQSAGGQPHPFTLRQVRSKSWR